MTTEPGEAARDARWRGLPGAAGCQGRTSVSELGGARNKDPLGQASEEKAMARPPA
jgi:hypothetical protein